MEKVSTLLLLHGAWPGAWSWEHLIPYLSSSHFSVLAPDLPGRNGDERCPSLQDHVAFVHGLIEKNDQPVFIVAHSFAGIIASQLAEIIPERISGIAYIAAFLLRNGQSLFDSITDNPSEIMAALTFSGSYLDIDANAAKNCFYHQSAPEVANWASKKLCPEAVEPMQTPLEEVDLKVLNLFFKLSTCTSIVRLELFKIRPISS